MECHRLLFILSGYTVSERLNMAFVAQSTASTVVDVSITKLVFAQRLRSHQHVPAETFRRLVDTYCICASPFISLPRTILPHLDHGVMIRQKHLHIISRLRAVACRNTWGTCVRWNGVHIHHKWLV